MAKALVVLLLLGAATLAGCSSGVGTDPAATPTGSLSDCLAGLAGLDLNTATLPQLQQALGSGRITSVQLVDAYLARIAAFDHGNAQLNSIRNLSSTARQQAAALDAERATGHVRGSLHGIPVLLKDNIGTNDMPTTAGSIALAGNVPPKDATVTARLRDAGMIILGKTNLDEFAGINSAASPKGFSSLGGQVVNAYTGGTPFGSSSGSAVGSSMAFATITLGTETGGSIVGPSIINSQVGLKTTTGIVSRTGVIPYDVNVDTVGPIGRNVEDLAAVMDAMAGTDPKDPATKDADQHFPAGGFTAGLRADALKGARIGYEADQLGYPGMQHAFDVLRKEGATMVPVNGSDSNVGLVFGEGGSEFDAYDQFKAGLNAYLAHDAGPGIPVSDLTGIILYNQLHPDRFPYPQEQLVAADATPGNAQLGSASLQATILWAHQTLDPLYDGEHLDAILDAGSFNAVGDLIGYPTIVIPVGYEDGVPDATGILGMPPGKQVDHLPIGVGLAGPAWSDARLLALAYAFEQATHARIPPTVLNASLVKGTCDATPSQTDGSGQTSLPAGAAMTELPGRAPAKSGAVAVTVRPATGP